MVLRCTIWESVLFWVHFDFVLRYSYSAILSPSDTSGCHKNAVRPHCVSLHHQRNGVVCWSFLASIGVWGGWIEGGEEIGEDVLEWRKGK